LNLGEAEATHPKTKGFCLVLLKEHQNNLLLDYFIIQTPAKIQTSPKILLRILNFE